MILGIGIQLVVVLLLPILAMWLADAWLRCNLAIVVSGVLLQLLALFDVCQRRVVHGLGPMLWPFFAFDSR